jgi:hypothetical protein
MALGLTQPLTEMITRNISWGESGRCVGLTTLTRSCADSSKIWEPQSPENSGPVKGPNPPYSVCEGPKPPTRDRGGLQQP